MAFGHGGTIFIEDRNSQTDGTFLTVTSIDSDSFIEPYLPNKLPRSCAFDMWAYFDEEGGLDENSITFMDNTNIEIDCVTRHSDSCSFDFDYIATVLDDGEDANVYVDTSGNGYNFEYGTEIGKCTIIDETSSDFSIDNVIEVLSESSDYHKESLQYLVHQNTNGMKSSVDTNGINIEMYIAVDNYSDPPTVEYIFNETVSYHNGCLDSNAPCLHINGEYHKRTLRISFKNNKIILCKMFYDHWYTYLLLKKLRL